MGICPFDKKTCKAKCVLYRKGLRYFDDPTKKPVPFEECAINVGVDCLENLIGRSIGQQKATEQTRNELVALKELFYSLAQRKAIEDLKKDMRDGSIVEVTE
jgi:hypothetical protein